MKVEVHLSTLISMDKVYGQLREDKNLIKLFSMLDVAWKVNPIVRMRSIFNILHLNFRECSMAFILKA